MAPLRIGLTGGIASGKSTVARRFAELGATVIDADEVARAVVAPGEPALAQIERRFGRAVLCPDGTLNRRALRGLVFADAAARRDLEAILHPPIRAEMARRATLATGPYVLLVIPLLVEGGPRDDLDRILVVDAAEEAQLARLTARDGSSPAEARAILSAQASRADRLARADDVLRNDGELATLIDEVDRLHRHYLRLAAARV